MGFFGNPSGPTRDVTVLTVLGPECRQCQELTENAEAVARGSGGTVEVERVADPVVMMASGAMAPPALKVDGRLVSQGKVLGVQEIEDLL